MAVLVHNAGVMGATSSGPTIHEDPHFLTNHVVRYDLARVSISHGAGNSSVSGLC